MSTLHFRKGLALTLFIAILGVGRIGSHRAGAQGASPSESSATTVVLQQGLNGYQGTDDSFLDSWYPDTNYGPVWSAVVRSGGVKRPVIRFDLSTIPAGATVSNATLELFSDNTYGSAGTPLTVAAHVLRRLWQENQATWHQAAGGQNWGTPGADNIVSDRSDVVVAAATVSALGTWYTWDVTAAVQGWVADRNSNKGLILIGSSDQTTEFRFFSSEYGSTNTFRPKLTISYEAAAQSPTPTPTKTTTTVPTSMPTTTATSTPAPSPANPDLDDTPLGVNFLGEATDPAAWALAGQAGIRWGRVELAWRDVEPANSLPVDFQWDRYDQIVASAEAAGMSPLFVVGHAPGWAATYSCGPIDKVDIDEFVQLFDAAVRRYPSVRYWELTNEPDWNIAPGPTMWVAVGGGMPPIMPPSSRPRGRCCRIRAPVDSCCSGGLAAEVVGWWYQNQCTWPWPGPNYEPCFNFSINGGDFFDQVLAGGGPYFDRLTVHYYYVFHTRWDPYGNGVSGKVNYFQQRLTNFGEAAKPVAITEIGYRSDPRYIVDGQPSSNEQQSRYLTWLYVRARANGYGPVIWFTLRDYNMWDGVHAHGLLDINMNPKPSYYAAQTYAREIGPAPPVSGRYFGAGFESYRFATASGGYTEVAWTTSELTTTVPLPCPRVRTVDKWGALSFVIDGSANDADGQLNGQAGVRISPSPLYLRLCPAGDVDCDGTVGADDLTTAATDWGLHTGDPAYDSSHDQNGDGAIDLLDVMIAAAHQGDSCAWTP